MKKILCFILCLTAVFSLFGCALSDIEVDGVIYSPLSNDSYAVDRIQGKEKVIYIKEEVAGMPVDYIGSRRYIGGNSANLSTSAERVYLPWRTKDICVSIYTNPNTYYFYTNVEKSPSRQFYSETKCVVPSIAHKNIQNQLICANIAYLFNYDGNPNEGYFFIDLLEESGTLTPPPYSPKRDSYVFDGWYKDEACTKAWNFDTDTVTIEKDSEGNRVYEEIKLYAKWRLP